MALIIEVIKGGSDNFAYVVGCSSLKEVAVIDPVSAHTILEFCGKKKLRVICILNTHGHPDHTSGNEVIASSTGARVMAHPADRIVNISTPLKNNDEIKVGKFKIKVIHTPGHTMGSLCFKVNNKLFTGDTLFLAGAGNTRFGGTVEDMFVSFRDKILPLSDRTEVCPGHDYAENNLRFARTLEPDNPNIEAKLKELKDANRNGHRLKSTIGQEKKYNPFMRFKRPELIESLRTEYPEHPLDDPLEVFRLIRELRDHW
ncbi:MAG TPA: hydroxyacylglutathione hydrolase [bacterium]|nr:hydroxyacylglutathione hydrolase [bacterium]